MMCLLILACRNVTWANLREDCVRIMYVLENASSRDIAERILISERSGSETWTIPGGGVAMGGGSLTGGTSLEETHHL